LFVNNQKQYKQKQTKIMEINTLPSGGRAAHDLATLNDIVFEHRNKEYGAYDLRQRYPQTVQKALLIGVATALTMITLPSIYAKFSVKQTTATNLGDTRWTDVNITPQEPIIEPEKPIELPKPATVKYQLYNVETDAPDNTPVPTVDELDKAQPASITTDGDDGGESEIMPPADNIPPPPATKAVEVATVILDGYNVEIQPEFPGGINGFKNFLVKHLKYPNAAQSAGVSGKVYLQFTVNQDGSLENIAAIKGIGYGCDEEAIRVMKLMPAWKPGRQSGRAVRVKFNLPIVFSLE
jgi:protein TonB